MYMNQEARTALGYCRLDALMPHQFIVNLWPLSLWHCQHLLFLSWNIFRFSYSYILVIIQLFKQHFPTMHLTDSFSPIFSFFFFLASLAYFFILAIDCIFLIALYGNSFVCRNSGNFAHFVSKSECRHRKQLTLILSLLTLLQSHFP